jgi:hypothetical protein
MNLPALPHDLKYRLLNWSDRADALNAAVEYGVLCARWAREEAAKIAEEIALVHQRSEGAYSAGKKAGTLECSTAIRKDGQG